jgi:hypothetical protein
LRRNDEKELGSQTIKVSFPQPKTNGKIHGGFWFSGLFWKRSGK